MTDFRTRRIRTKPPLRPFKKLKDSLLNCGRIVTGTTKKQRSYALGSISVVVAAFIVVKVTMGFYTTIKDFDPKDVVFSLGADLKQDEFGYTNLMLLGDGGHIRDGADLIDTIMVASLDFNNRKVSLMSIPRDYYVRSEQYGKAKINELYRNNKAELGEEGGYEAFMDVGGQITGLDIQYYARVDFGAFVEVIDSLGGISLEVKESIYDPYYPNETDNGYTVFEVDAGIQEMNGETALKFVRSRKTTSDFDRAARQQQVLMAIKDKALSGNVLTSPSTIKKLYQSVSGNINTNMSLREMLAMASFAKDFERENMVMKVLHDDPGRDGGFLYTPERKYYNGQFVLVADGDSLDLINKYADLIFHRREVLLDPVKIEILNATKVPGIARNVTSHLNRFGFNLAGVDNLKDGSGKRKYVERSFIRYGRWKVDLEGTVIAEHQSTLDALENFVKGDPIPSDEPFTEEGGADISIVLGDDYEIY